MIENVAVNVSPDPTRRRPAPLRSALVGAVIRGGRTLTVELESGYPAAQLFSPRGRDFICFEAVAVSMPSS